MVKAAFGKQYTYKSNWDWSFGVEGSAYTGMDQKAFMNQQKLNMTNIQFQASKQSN